MIIASIISIMIDKSSQIRPVKNLNHIICAYRIFRKKSSVDFHTMGMFLPPVLIYYLK